MSANLTATKTADLKSVTLADIKQKFDQVNTNNDGTIAFSEIYAAIKKTHPEVDDAYIKQVWNSMDRNNDESIDFAEYCGVFGQVYWDYLQGELPKAS